MALSQLQIRHWRNLQHVDFDCSPEINVIWGDNGSGKTSVLEAIYFLSTGRSFRTVKSQRLVQDGFSAATLFCVSDAGTRFGIEKSHTGISRAQLNGQALRRLSDIALLVPAQLIDPSMMDLLSGPSQPRRQLLDWLVFHVKPSAATIFSQYHRALAQRNSLLRNVKISKSEIEYWEKELAVSGSQINNFRREIYDSWLPLFLSLLNAALAERDFSVDFFAGWDDSLCLEQVLAENRLQDSERGFSFYGPHRADFKLKTNGKIAAEYLSRGQIKQAVCYCKISSLQFLESFQIKPILLLDDLGSELDASAMEKIVSLLLGLKSQIWITTISLSSAMTNSLNSKNIQMFHMKHGTISTEVGEKRV